MSTEKIILSAYELGYQSSSLCRKDTEHDDDDDVNYNAPNNTAYTRWNLSQRSDIPATSNGGPDLPFLCKPAMRTRWMAGTAPHKSGRCQD